MTCKYCPFNTSCRFREEEVKENIFKRFLNYIFREDKYIRCPRYSENRILKSTYDMLKVGVG